MRPANWARARARSFRRARRSAFRDQRRPATIACHSGWDLTSSPPAIEGRTKMSFLRACFSGRSQARRSGAAPATDRRADIPPASAPPVHRSPKWRAGRFRHCRRNATRRPFGRAPDGAGMRDSRQGAASAKAVGSLTPAPITCSIMRSISRRSNVRLRSHRSPRQDRWRPSPTPGTARLRLRHSAPRPGADTAAIPRAATRGMPIMGS